VLLSAVGVKGWAKPWCGLLCIEAWIVFCVSAEMESLSSSPSWDRDKAVPLADVVNSETTCEKDKDSRSCCADRVVSVLKDELVKPWSSCSAVNDSTVLEAGCCVNGEIVESLPSSVVVKGSLTASLQELDAVSDVTTSKLSTGEV
jgi:hypothetical protein